MTGQAVVDAQGELLPRAPRLRTVTGNEAGGVTDPVARVILDLALPHLDRPFDYLVRPEQDEAAQPGARVSVRFGATDRSGFIIERATTTEHPGRLSPLRRVVSPLAVLTPEVLELCRTVARYYAGSLMDVVRLAVPPRHAGTETKVLESPEEIRTGQTTSWLAPNPHPWQDYPAGPAFLEHVAAGRSPRAVWDALPGDWCAAVAEAAAATLAGGRGVLIVVPTATHIAALTAALHTRMPSEPVVELHAEHGPSRRYRAFLRVLTGRARLVVGTRSAAFAPLPRPGLLMCWDDGNDVFAEPRAPYPHAREVLAMRAQLSGAAILVGGWSRTVETTGWVERHWAHAITAARATVRARTPRIIAPTPDDLAAHGEAGHARVPPPAWRLIRDALQHGPVLVQVPRAGYLPTVACAQCRAEARCRQCHGPLQLAGRNEVPLCRWCGRMDQSWACTECASKQLRAVHVGSGRTAEEFGRAFPHVPVLLSGARADHGVVEAVDESPRIVVATPGAEPTAAGGYRAGLLLDAAMGSGSAILGVNIAAMRRWVAAAALVQPAADGGQVMLLGNPPRSTAQALVRWDPAGLAQRELVERRELALPPAVRAAAVTAAPATLRAFLRALRLPASAEVLGPVPLDAEELRVIVRAPLADGIALSTALHAAAAQRSAHRDPPVRIQVDAVDLS